MKIFICLVVFLFQISVMAQTFNPGLPTTAAPSAPGAPATSAPASSGSANNAEGASGSSMMTGLMEAGVSAGMGVYLMATAGPNHMQMVMGASLVVAGAADAVQAQGYGNTGSQIAVDPTLPADPGGVADPYIQGLLNTANQIAAANGTTVPALANQADSGGGGGGGGGGMGSFANNLPQSVKDGMAKAAADASAHYRVLSVATEGAGGGGKKDDAPFDLNSILNGLKNDRSPASIAGLQKSLNGEPIGVAQDNIFKQITRKYQDKIALRMFLPIQK